MVTAPLCASVCVCPVQPSPADGGPFQSKMACMVHMQLARKYIYILSAQTAHPHLQAAVSHLDTQTLKP